MTVAVTVVHLTTDDLFTMISEQQTSIVAGPVSLVLPHDPFDAIAVAGKLRSLLRGCLEHLNAQALAESEALERAAGRAVNESWAQANAEFGVLPSREVVQIPVQTASPVDTPESAA